MEKKTWSYDGWNVEFEVGENVGSVWEVTLGVQLANGECVSLNNKIAGKYRPYLGKDAKGKYRCIKEKDKQSTVE